MDHAPTAVATDDLFDFILADLVELKIGLFAPRSLQVIMASMKAMQWFGIRS